MFYNIRHVTTFHYSTSISESMMEVRLQPRTEDRQRCVRFQIALSPKSALSMTRDYLGNVVHGFDIPGQHDRLAITTESIVEVDAAPPVPESLPAEAWLEYSHVSHDFDLYDMLLPGKFTVMSPALAAFMQEMDFVRRIDPLSLVKEINAAIYNTFDYDQTTTDVDSTIDEVLEMRRGVCQDYVHVMLAALRYLGIPARYISGYLFHRQNYDRSAVDASHAWLEAWFPTLGWVGFDPTNNLICQDRHIRVAVGRDYADVPPTKGVFKGAADTELKVSVQVKRMENVPTQEEALVSPYDYSLAVQNQRRIQIQQQQQQ
jgi:transglutaminase-like putative cysteine protease